MQNRPYVLLVDDSKPFPLKDLRARIAQVIEKVNLRTENAELQQKLAEANVKIKALFERYTPEPVANAFCHSRSYRGWAAKYKRSQFSLSTSAGLHLWLKPWTRGNWYRS